MMKARQEFQSARTPLLEDFKGRYIVRLIIPLFPPIRILGHFKFFPDRVMEEGGGYNCFLGFIKIGNFRVDKGASETGDGEEVVKIIYDAKANPFYIRPLVDELKQTGKDRYIGRGIYRFRNRKRNIFYFTVTRAGS